MNKIYSSHSLWVYSLQQAPQWYLEVLETLWDNQKMVNLGRLVQ